MSDIEATLLAANVEDSRAARHDRRADVYVIAKALRRIARALGPDSTVRYNLFKAMYADDPAKERLVVEALVAAFVGAHS